MSDARALRQHPGPDPADSCRRRRGPRRPRHVPGRVADRAPNRAEHRQDHPTQHTQDAARHHRLPALHGAALVVAKEHRPQRPQRRFHRQKFQSGQPAFQRDCRRRRCRRRRARRFSSRPAKDEVLIPVPFPITEFSVDAKEAAGK